MSDKKPDKVKRGYRAAGRALGYDLRVRIDEDIHKRLAEYAARNGITRAAAAREILNNALSDK